MQSTDSTPQLRRKVTSPNGTTEAAIKTFEANQLKELVRKALTAARDRSIELAKESNN